MATSTADAAAGNFARVRIRLTGKLTPLRRKQASLASNSSESLSDSTESRGEHEEEAELSGLLDAAVTRAEHEHAELRRSKPNPC